MSHNTPCLVLEALRRRMAEAMALYYTVRDADDSPPVVIRTLGEAAVTAIDAYTDMFDRYARVYEDVRREHDLQPHWIN
jgi:hypothetical protein